MLHIIGRLYVQKPEINDHFWNGFLFGFISGTTALFVILTLL